MPESQEPWFKAAFQSHYLDVYAHRTLEEAKAHLPRIIELAQLSTSPCPSKNSSSDASISDGPILDLGCGNGRYSQLLQDLHYPVVGLDYSHDLLRDARSKSPDAPLVKGNMLELPFRACFSRVLSLFTSFGYFDQDEKNSAVLAQMSQALKSSGLLYLDFLNPTQVKASPWQWQDSGSYRMKSMKSIDPELNMVIKDIELYQNEQQVSSYQERVKLYDRAWFTSQAAEHGLECLNIYGDYEAQPYQIDSPRQIFIFRKS